MSDITPIARDGIMDTVPQQVATKLRRQIVADMQPGDKLPGMHQLRQQFGISINTMGAALNILTSDGVVEKRNGVGVYVAEGATCPRIGILSELDLMDVRISPYFRVVAQSLRSQLRERGADPKLYVGNAEPGSEGSDTPTCPEFWSDIESGKLDAAIALDVPTRTAWHSRFLHCPIPSVGFLCQYNVIPDITGVTDAAVRALAERGCRTIGLLAREHCADQFLEAVTKHKLQTRDTWIHIGIHGDQPGTGWQVFRDIWLSSKRPDGLLIVDDMLFADVQLAIMELGIRVPEELQLAILTNRNASPLVRLPAVTFEFDPEQAAQALAIMVLQLLRGEVPEPAEQIIPFRKVENQMAGYGIQ